MQETEQNNPPISAHTALRIGHGYDIHRLEPKPGLQGVPAATEAGILSAYANERSQPVRPMLLGGLEFESPTGPVGHSDGDAVLHAITDAMLGAIGESDLGSLFPDSDPANDGRNSAEFVQEAHKRVSAQGYALSNIDITVIAEHPKIGPRRQELRSRIASILHTTAERVNIKGKTHESVDAVGEGRAIEVHAVVLLARVGTAS